MAEKFYLSSLEKFAIIYENENESENKNESENNTDMANLYNNLGMLYKQQGKLEEAKINLEKSLQLRI